MRLVRLLAIGLMVLVGPPAFAGDAGLQSPFALGAGARDLALGGSGLYASDPVTAVYWNPSALARVDRMALGGFHTRLFESGVSYQYLGGAVPTMDLGGFGFGVFRLGVDGIEERDADNVLYGETSESRLAVYLGYGRSISDYDVGLALSIEHHSLGDYSAISSPGLDLSIDRGFKLRSERITEITFALSGHNLLPPHVKLVSESVAFPSEIDASVSAEVHPSVSWDHGLTISAGVSKADGIDPRPTAGLEYRMDDLLRLRAGLRDGDACFGAGLTYRAISFDYALVGRDLGSLHMFSISTDLGRPMSAKRRVREARREAEFDELINRSLTQRNLDMVSGLVQKGNGLMEEGSFDEAGVALERAIFLAEGSGLDTAEVYRAAESAGRALAEAVRKRDFEADMDSAWSRLAVGDYPDARYYAVQALSGFPDSKAAKDVLAQIEDRIEQNKSGEIALERSLLQADSLASYGRFDEALVIAGSLGAVARNDVRVQMVVKKAEFGRWKEAAELAFAGSDYATALAAVDSALARFPNHPWGLALSRRIHEQSNSEVAHLTGERQETSAALSDELEKEVEEAYRAGQKLFEQGNLSNAVRRWEQVDALAPGYKSVRGYLVNAYKFLGVELYSQDRLEEAVAIWKKAANLDPGSSEIANYIRRTEGEISRLQEMSYDSR
jgi:tetratricopeptide (TPR) repeat protein